ncbi:MAG: hypothetical protein EZS28_019132 [Streblomastix strix]|uniref:Uncharacterized protein n=1 Tax=Streblomastix strix TaxID=222440 RepID=A0A5J4VRX9_9EUKA|nr:MAG: hypothetical protein EZS28_019132 [Streblomastix strix]
MGDILDSGENRKDERKPHPLFESMRRDGVIYLVNQNCLLHGETEDIKQNAAVVLGILLRAQDIQPTIRQSIIKHLKKLIIENAGYYNVGYLLDIMCGLAVKQSNISEIVSDNFIETTVKLIEQQNEYIKSNALELLLNIAQNGGSDIEKEIKTTIGNLKFLELIGDSNFTLNEQILQVVMKCK